MDFTKKIRFAQIFTIIYVFSASTYVSPDLALATGRILGLWMEGPSIEGLC